MRPSGVTFEHFWLSPSSELLLLLGYMQRRTIWGAAFITLLLGFATPIVAQRPTPLQAGDSLPEFHATDQFGKVRAFNDLTGEGGLVLFFHKSADW